MINPLTGLLAQAEVSLADLARRTVENVTVPIRLKGQELAAEATDAALRVVKAVLIKTVLGLVAAVMAVVAVVYLVAALYWELLPRLGPVEARLVLAGIFALMAIAALVLLAVWPKSTAPAPAKRARDAAAEEMRRAMADAQASAEAARRAGMAGREAHLAAGGAEPEAAGPDDDAHVMAPGNLKAGVETLADMLGDAGYRREQAGLRAGLALAAQLKPMQLVTLALVGGFVAALRYPPHRGRRRR